MEKVLIFTAGNNNNLRLAKCFEDEIKKIGESSEIINLVTNELPLYTSEKEYLNEHNKWVDQIVDKMKRAKIFIVLGPEYNGGIPPALTNFIAWVSRSGNSDWRECFNNKKCAIGTHSGGGGFQFLNMMRLQLSFLGANVLGRQIRITGTDTPNLESISNIVDSLLKF